MIALSEMNAIFTLSTSIMIGPSLITFICRKMGLHMLYLSKIIASKYTYMYAITCMEGYKIYANAVSWMKICKMDIIKDG